MGVRLGYTFLNVRPRIFDLRPHAATRTRSGKNHQAAKGIGICRVPALEFGTTDLGPGLEI